MPFPVDWNLVEVRGEYLATDGTPMKGKIMFTPAASRVIDSEVKVVLIGKTVTVPLDASGKFTVELPAGDDPDVNPTGFNYLVKEDFTGGLSYYMEVPLAALVDGVEMAAVSPAVSPDPGTGTGGGSVVAIQVATGSEVRPSVQTVFWIDVRADQTTPPANFNTSPSSTDMWFKNPTP